VPDSADSFLKLCEGASHEYIRLRKEAIDQAAEMLERQEHRQELLAILDYLVHNDLMASVRDKAQAVLETQTLRKADVHQLFPAEDSRFIQGYRCPNGHVTYFDRRRLCSDEVEGQRIVRAGLHVDTREVTCGTCGIAMSVHVGPIL